MASVVVERVVTRYACSTCNKSWSRRARANAHLKRGCPKDPEARACGSCRFDMTDLEPGQPTCARNMLRALEDNRCRYQCPGWEPARMHVSHIIDLVVAD